MKKSCLYSEFVNLLSQFSLKINAKHTYYTVPQYLPILFAPCHALLIDWAIQLSLTWKDDFIVANYSLDDFVNMSLTCYRILAIWDGHQSWTKADS